MSFCAILTELVLFLLCNAIRFLFSTKSEPLEHAIQSRVQKNKRRIPWQRRINIGKIRPAFIERELRHSCTFIIFMDKKLLLFKKLCLMTHEKRRRYSFAVE